MFAGCAVAAYTWSMDSPEKTIVVAIDDNEPSRRAVDAALVLVRPGEALNFVHAVDSASVLLPVSEGMIVDTQPLLKELMDDAQALCNAAIAKARERGITATSTIVHGAAADAIVRFATATNPDMIVLGTHARTGLSRLFNGSVAEEILRSSPVPVAVAHVDDVERVGPLAVALNDSESSRAAFHCAVARARQSGEALLIVYVRPAHELHVTPPFIEHYDREAQAAGIAVSSVIWSGEIAHAIVGAADEHHCSAIVMGTEGRSAIERIIEHSIANRVVEIAKLPVAVVRAVPDRSTVAVEAVL